MCAQLSKTVDHSSSSSSSLSSATSTTSHHLSRSISQSSKGSCAICLNSMKPGQGHAIFTAECSHSFHFQCITSSVKHGNQICPVCRAKWKEVPFQSCSSKVSHDINRAKSPRNNSWLNFIWRFSSQHHESSEPAIFDDDEVLDRKTSAIYGMNEANVNVVNKMEIRTCTEVSAIAKSDYLANYSVLIHLKAPYPPGKDRNAYPSSAPSSILKNRAPIDLVTVLDVSGSMSGSKIALLKQAMSFVIHHLRSSDRLSVITFSSTARRVFPLRRMTVAGKQEAEQAVQSLIPNGGTNIAEGLRKAAKVFVDRKWKNPVASIILLSDGQDSTMNSSSRLNVGTDHQSLVPNSIHRRNCMGLHIPVHAFGLGVDHDATAMRSISETSGGTFSFIEDEDMIQNVFARCIGGLLSVVVQELEVEVQCVHPDVKICSVKAGSYLSNIICRGKLATIKVGDMHAEEKRDILVTVNVPVVKSSDEMIPLFVVKGVYWDPISEGMKGMGVNNEVKIERLKVVRDVVKSIDVDMKKNKFLVLEAMAEAEVNIKKGDFSAAISVVKRCEQALFESISGKAGDPLCIAMCDTLNKFQLRTIMTSRLV